MVWNDRRRRPEALIARASPERFCRLFQCAFQVRHLAQVIAEHAARSAVAPILHKWMKQGQAMAIEGLILGWSRRERERLQMQREMLQSGKFRILKDEGSGPIDVSSQNIAQITANIAELDLILADYDVRSSASQSIPIDKLNASNDD
jgi:hypothetical protein